MAWKSKPPLSLFERVKKVYEATLKENIIQIPSTQNSVDKNETCLNHENSIEGLNKRIEKILGITQHRIKSTEMLFFVMYDIESNKVRYQVVKYLLREGCHRIQKSIFLAKLSGEKYKKISADLATIQAFYQNEDSIILVPISTDYIQAMRIIGKSVNIDLIMKNKNTLFF